jgi:hypothetical protein
MNRPNFLITIDTEGDNLWDYQPRIGTRNAQFLERFQSLCERYGFKPSYLANYEMATDAFFQSFARDVLKRGQGEVGMHLHAWNSPPIAPITDNDYRHKPYLIDYPVETMRAKVDYMTKLLADTFASPMRCHRAGRWALNATYVRLLIEFGYQVDCSVTPHVDWRGTSGAPGGGGTDYRNYPTGAYFMDPDHPERSGNSDLLQVPMSILPKHPDWVESVRAGLQKLRGRQKPRSLRWLRPRGGNAQEMIGVCRELLGGGADYVEFMLHSSEFMPGGSPTFKDEASIEYQYADLEDLFSYLASVCEGKTLSEYYAVKRALSGRAKPDDAGPSL